MYSQILAAILKMAAILTTGCCEGVSISNIGHMYYSTKFYASTQKCKVFCLAAPLLCAGMNNYRNTP